MNPESKRRVCYIAEPDAERTQSGPKIFKSVNPAGTRADSELWARSARFALPGSLQYVKLGLVDAVPLLKNYLCMKSISKD